MVGQMFTQFKYIVIQQTVSANNILMSEPHQMKDCVFNLETQKRRLIDFTQTMMG